MSKPINKIDQILLKKRLECRIGNDIASGRVGGAAVAVCQDGNLLYENRSRTVQTREIEAILGEQAEKSNAVAVYLYRLRRKLEQDGVTRIRTVRGVGYRWIGES